MPRRSTILPLALGMLLSSSACQNEPTVRACLSENGEQDDCGTACIINQSSEACEKWQQMTVELCERTGKRTCESICRGDSNPYACEQVRKM